MYKLLNEKWLESLPEPVVENLQQQNAEVIKIICDRIKYFGNLRPTEINKLTNSVAFAGADLKKIEKLIMRYVKLNRAEVQKILQSAAMENDTFAEQFYKYRGLHPIQTGADSYLQGLLSALSETTAAGFQNLSNTYGFKFPNRQAATLRQTYSSIIDRAIYEIKTGVTDYNTALRQSVRQLADSGIRVVDWASGVTRRADTAARMNILDGVRQLSQQMLNYHAQQYGSNGVELSAHAISAPDHVEAQGHQFTNAEFEKMQSGADFEDVNGKSYAGFKRPIGQWNCKHLAFPIIIGVSQPAHSESELNRLKQNSAEKYELTQEMRRKETNLRKLKERRMAYSAAGNDLDAMRTQREINEETRSYKAFCKENSLAPQNSRTDVDGFRKIGANRGTNSAAEPKIAKGVHFVGKIDKEIFSYVAQSVSTEDVIITDERIEHIKERHPNDLDLYSEYMKYMVQKPQYIIETDKANTAVILNEFENGKERFKLILRLKTEADHDGYKNSIISFWKIGNTTWNKLLRNKKILYKSK